MMKINEIWAELESDKSSNTGLLLRRYSAHVIPDIYIALRHPESLRCLAIKFKLIDKPDLSRFSNLKDIKIEFTNNDKQSEFYYLTIILLNPEHAEVFSVFCEDLVTAISSFSDEKKVIQEFLNRLEKWRSLFEIASQSGLSPEAQLGLYGELYFLRKWITSSNKPQRCVKAWLGPEKQIRDFQINDWGLEIKATRGNNHQKVHISSERQLDRSNLTSLFLFHLSVEYQQLNGETLNDIVDDLTLRFQDNIHALRDFRIKLILAGYYKHHSVRYEDAGYQIRNQTFYQIKDDFPRIEESDIRAGVGDVKYSILLSDCVPYITDETTVIEIINKHE